MALESALLVDGGKTVVFQGLRVTTDMRGHGIGGALQKHVTDYIHCQYPEVCTVRRSRGDQPSPQILSKYRLIAKEVSHCSHVALWELISHSGTKIWSLK